MLRNYLRHSLISAYATMNIPAKEWGQESTLQAPLDNTELIDRIRNAAYERRFGPPGQPSLLKCLFQELIDEIKLTRDNVEREDGSPLPRASLCWAIALDAALLDKYLQIYIRTHVLAGNQIEHEIPTETHFYRVETLDEKAINLFQEFVRVKWPIITFALDPVTDQQNIADSFNLKRDLQLALSYAFATGQIGFNQLNTFRRQIEQSADTIALNRTVTGFVHGSDVFGWRFTPRYQNPPNQRTNFGVIASQLISGGPGPDYQIKNSKLESGMRELTAVFLLPTFLPVMRINVTGNWFRLNDPEHLVYHTRRQMEDGRRVQEVRQTVLCDPRLHQYRADDLRVLHAKLDMLDAMLPTQSKVIQLPFENTACGFDLFSEGATALVPELTGFSGVDIIQAPPAAAAAATPATPVAGSPGLQVSTTTTGTATFTTTSIVGGTGSIADLFVFGKYISLLDTKVIAGGRSAAFEILSREVIHIQVPANAIPTTTEDGKSYIEIFLSTPNGASNSLLVPFKPANATPLVAFDLASTQAPVDVFYQWLGPDGKQKLVPTVDPGTKGITITWDASTSLGPKRLQVTFQGTVGGQQFTFAIPADVVNKDDYTVDQRLFTVTLLNRLQNIVTAPAAVTSPLTLTVFVQPWIPPDGEVRVRTAAKQLKSSLTVNLNYNATGQNALPTVMPVPLPPPPPPPPAAGAGGAMLDPSGRGQTVADVRTKDTAILRTAQAAPTAPGVLSLPQPPPFLDTRVLQSPNVGSEAEQVARMLTGQPFNPNRVNSTLASQVGGTPVGALASQVATTVAGSASTAPGQPIVVLPAPVVVLPPKPDIKQTHSKSRFHPSRILKNLGNRVNQGINSLQSTAQ